jgi:hypothetical protein
MSKFKVGDKVWFDKYAARKEGERIAPGMCGWISSVPDGLLTISEFMCGSDRVIKVKECDFIFSPDWLVRADEVKKTDKMEVKIREGRIENVIFRGPATIVFWTDGTKTVVKCRKGDEFDPEKGIAMACAKKLLGNEDGYHKEIAKYTKDVLDTEKLRSIIKASCREISCLTGAYCPCHPNNDNCCCTISCADRAKLLKMYDSFKRAGMLKGVE